MASGYSRDLTSMLYKKPLGSALIELAIVLPFLLLLFLGGTDLANLMNRYHDMTSLSRQIGAAALRLCASALPGTDTVNCLNNQVLQVIAPDASDILPGVKLAVSAVHWNTSAPPGLGNFVVNPIDQVVYPVGAILPVISRGAFLPDFPPGSESVRALLLNQHRVLMYAEVFLRYEPLVSFLPFMERLSERDLHVTAVF